MKKTIILGFAAIAAAPFALAEPTHHDVEAVLKRDFHAHGQATMDRVVQDVPQRICTDTDNKPPKDLEKALESDELNAIPFPSGGLMGDWKKGAKIAANGRGKQWSDKPDAANGGSCYNCHQLSPQEQSYGTIGPSLKGFGKLRGNNAQTQKYAYGKIYNAKAYSLCSNMPRFGTSRTLTEQQIKDLVAYLLDPDSPVNK